MRKLVIIEFMSLDGVVQAPGDPKEDTFADSITPRYVDAGGEELIAAAVGEED